MPSRRCSATTLRCSGRVAIAHRSSLPSTVPTTISRGHRPSLSFPTYQCATQGRCEQSSCKPPSSSYIVKTASFHLIT
ncbi:putative ATP synthase subunit beta, mitochondrial [Sesbania bispinosa]|nr:putative ATP synthase subunit beta, mitochondrial [Sesbania bispinosa]